MSTVGYARNSAIHLGDYTPYLRLGKCLFDPSGMNASYLYNSLSREEMFKYLMKSFTKEEIVTMLLDFVEKGDDYQGDAA